MLGTTPPIVEGATDEALGEEADEPIVAAVVAYFPPTDLMDYVTDEKSRQQFPALQFDAELAPSVSPLGHVSSDNSPTLLVHGTNDELVPIKHSEQMQKALEASGVATRRLVIEGAGHGFQGDDERQVTECDGGVVRRAIAPGKRPPVMPLGTRLAAATRRTLTDCAWTGSKWGNFWLVPLESL